MTFQRFAIGLLGGLGRWLFRVRYIGTEHIPAQGAVILASNHISAWDPLLHAFRLKRDFRIMAKKELFRFKPFGWLLRKVGAFPVDRGHGDRGAVTAARSVLDGGGMLLIFPEGTRSKTGALLPFKSGAAMLAVSTGTPVVPAIIRAEGHIGLFRPTVIEYGEPVLPAALSPDGSTAGPAIKAASAVLRARMEEMQKRGIPDG